MCKQCTVNLPKEIKKKLGIDGPRIPLPLGEDAQKKKIASDGTILLDDEEDYDTTD